MVPSAAVQLQPVTADALLAMPDDVRLLTENHVLNGGDVVPGWTLPLRGLFA